MNESKNKMPRGQWMATEGRHLYHGWLSDAINVLHELHNLTLTKVSSHPDKLYENLESLSEDVTEELMLFYKSASIDENVLYRSRNDLYFYTSLDEFIGDGTPGHGLYMHTHDGLAFATQITARMAVEAVASTGAKRENSPAFYEDLADVLRNPSFHRVLEEFATTGFAVLGNVAKNSALKRPDDFMGVMNDKLWPMAEPAASLIQANVEGESPVFTLEPIVQKALTAKLRLQNKEKIVAQGGRAPTILARIEDASFTSGCPVRRAPVGEDKSAIALLSDYMGEKVQNVIVKKLRQQQLGSRVAAHTVIQS